MTEQDKEFLDRITSYANDVCADIDPQKTQISVQLERLMPIMKDLAKEYNSTPEEIFIKYMDLATEAMAKTEEKLQDTLKNMPGGGTDPMQFSVN